MASQEVDEEDAGALQAAQVLNVTPRKFDVERTCCNTPHREMSDTLLMDHADVDAQHNSGCKQGRAFGTDLAEHFDPACSIQSQNNCTSEVLGQVSQRIPFVAVIYCSRSTVCIW